MRKSMALRSSPNQPDFVAKSASEKGLDTSNTEPAVAVRTVPRSTMEQMIRDERESLQRKIAEDRRVGKIRLTDLQLAVLAIIVAKGGAAHPYGVYLDSIREGQHWTEQAVRQAVERLETLGILRVISTEDGVIDSGSRVVREVSSLEDTMNILRAESQRRADFLDRIAASVGELDRGH